MTNAESYLAPDRSIPPLDLTVGDLLRRAARDDPDRPALIEGVGDAAARGRWTYGDLLAEAERGARALLSRFQPGEHVAILAPNMAAWTFLQCAAALAGLVVVTVNPVLRPREIEYILGQSEAVGVFASLQHRDQKLLDVVQGMRDTLPLLREVIALDDWGSFASSGDDTTALPDVVASDPVMIQYTSGTTGAPKGALLSHYGVVNSGYFLSERLERGPGDVWLNPLPMFHTGGCVMGTLGTMASLGTQLVIADFDPALVLRLIEEERPVYALGVPTMVLALLEHPEFASRDTSSLEVFSSGATTVPPDLVRRIEKDFDVTFNMAMGQTESSSVIFMTKLDSTIDQKATTLGLPLRQWEVKIADEQGTPVPRGTQGEICCRGFGVMDGYYKMPDATKEAIDPDGWLHTGDLGRMDHDGYTSITGRIKDLIIRGGENIFPQEIENVMSAHPDVAEIAVVGVPDDRWGERPVAFVRKSPDAGEDAALLEAFAREHLASHKVPREWFFVASLPINAAGKVKKFELQDQYANRATDRVQ